MKSRYHFLLLAEAQYDEAIAHNNDELLFTAFEKGALPLINYLVEIDYWTSILEKRIKAQRDIELAWAELTAWQL